MKVKEIPKVYEAQLFDGEPDDKPGPIKTWNGYQLFTRGPAGTQIQIVGAKVSIGDWVVTSPDGGVTVYNDANFKALFTEVTEA